MTPTHNNPTIGGGGFHHVAIRARDFDAAVSFYTDVMGFVPAVAWKLADGTRATMLDTGDGNYLEIFERPNQAPPPKGTEHAILHFAIRTSDVGAATERARGAGCEITMEPKDVDIANTVEGRPTPVPVRIAFFRGPEGELVELFENELT